MRYLPPSGTDAFDDQQRAADRDVNRSLPAVVLPSRGRYMDGILRLRLYESIPGAEVELSAIERIGRLPPLRPGSFCGYLHRPGQLRAEIAASGLQVLDLVSVEGPAYLLDDLAARLADDENRRVVLETARALERVPELLGIGPHLLVTARKLTAGLGCGAQTSGG